MGLGDLLAWGERTFVMAIVNVTKDSFSGDGIADEPDVGAVAGRLAALAEDAGADLVDVGAMSTRPGAAEIPVEVERERVRAAMAGITTSTSLPISVDTYRAEVAEVALEAGAAIVNSVWGVSAPGGGVNRPLLEVVAAAGAGLVVMHNRFAAATVTDLGPHVAEAHYDDVVGEVSADLRRQLTVAVDAGIDPDQTIVDPGIGFGKTPGQSIELLRAVSRVAELGRPVLIGASRKSTLGHLLGDPTRDRTAATLAVTAIAASRGVDIVRVHDVAVNVDAARVGTGLSQRTAPRLGRE